MLIANLADLVEASIVVFRPKDNTMFAQEVNRKEEAHSLPLSSIFCTLHIIQELPNTFYIQVLLPGSAAPVLRTQAKGCIRLAVQSTHSFEVI